MNKKLLILILVCFSNLTALAQTQTQKSEQTETKLVILKRSTPNYPAIARKKGIEGRVRLKVTFKSDGEIGDISDITEENSEKMQKYGFTEQAIIAAGKIEFKPAIKDGQPITVTKLVEYSFTLF